MSAVPSSIKVMPLSLSPRRNVVVPFPSAYFGLHTSILLLRAFPLHVMRLGVVLSLGSRSGPVWHSARGSVKRQHRRWWRKGSAEGSRWKAVPIWEPTWGRQFPCPMEIVGHGDGAATIWAQIWSVQPEIWLRLSGPTQHEQIWLANGLVRPNDIIRMAWAFRPLTTPPHPSKYFLIYGVI